MKEGFWKGFEKRAAFGAALSVLGKSLGGAAKAGWGALRGTGLKTVVPAVRPHLAEAGKAVKGMGTAAAETVRRNPLKSTAIAGGAGLGAGYLAGRRGKNSASQQNQNVYVGPQGY